VIEWGGGTEGISRLHTKTNLL